MKATNKVLTLTAVLCVLAVVVMLLSLTLGHRQVRQPFTPPPFDPEARAGTPTVPEALGWTTLDAQVFRVSVCGVIVPTEDRADIWLTNPPENRVWLKLRLFDQAGNLLGETGLIRPGEYVQSVTLRTVPAGGTGVVLKIMAYEPETYHSAGAVSLNTVISQ